MRVCSRHFHKGEPAYEMMETDPDWASSLHLGHTCVTPTNTARSARRSKREQLRKETLQTPEMGVQQDANIEELQTKKGPSEPGEINSHQQNEEGTPDAEEESGQLQTEEGTHEAGEEDVNEVPLRAGQEKPRPCQIKEEKELETASVEEEEEQELHIKEQEE
ncbi:involucrin-like isoform X2 [Corythoichthys intestinalis]|uniref:involucrin-like isoform X2 n=1 Tax=Corythoichthys intestinalis TaxID=161448 RepID=UPI0025A5994D|nr:involucrin-like isoform X2 [Corythoichthys intestinalis]